MKSWERRVTLLSLTNSCNGIFGGIVKKLEFQSKAMSDRINYKIMFFLRMVQRMQLYDRNKIEDRKSVV